MSVERNINYLMSQRVEENSILKYHAISMDSLEMSRRRSAMRKILVHTKFKNAGDRIIDSMRIENTPFGYIVEDEVGAETILGYKNIDGDVETGFYPLNEEEQMSMPFK